MAPACARMTLAQASPTKQLFRVLQLSILNFQFSILNYRLTGEIHDASCSTLHLNRGVDQDRPDGPATGRSRKKDGG
jgi:hypothetical protein